jgi:glycerol-3-phosphate dehydrogenase subunit B
VKADIAVVGSGLSALVATRALQRAGRNPVLIWPGLSSLYFLYATVDVLGYASATASQPVEEPVTGVRQLIADNPDHPYARAGLAALQDGSSLLLEWLREAGFNWQGTLAHNLLLPTVTGTPKPSCLVPASMVAGDLQRDEPIAFCGFDGYQDFMPELAASNLARVWNGGRRTVAAVRVPLPGVKADRLFTSIDLARSFEDAIFRHEVAGRLRRAVRDDGARLGMPAVLGLAHDSDVHAEFEKETGHPVFEIPTVPPSVLGLRLFDRLRRHLQETGVEMIWTAPAHDADVVSGRCVRIHLKSAGREQPVEARAYILALEDAVDGAWRAGPRTVRDPFFHQVLAEHATPAERTDESLFQPQPFTTIGYRVSDRLQPIDENGHPLAANVFVAGGGIAGYDPTGIKARGGMAIATGYRAAQEAMAA